MSVPRTDISRVTTTTAANLESGVTNLNDWEDVVDDQICVWDDLHELCGPKGPPDSVWLPSRASIQTLKEVFEDTMDQLEHWIQNVPGELNYQDGKGLGLFCQSRATSQKDPPTFNFELSVSVVSTAMLNPSALSEVTKALSEVPNRSARTAITIKQQPNQPGKWLIATNGVNEML